MAEQGGAEQTEIQFGTVRNAVVHTPADDVVDEFKAELSS